MYCGQCGGQIDDDSRFCRYCGVLQVQAPNETNLDITGPEQTFLSSPKKRKDSGKAIGAIAVVILVIVFIASMGPPEPISSDSSKATADVAADNMEMLADNMEALADDTENMAGKADTSVNAEVWSYTTDVDKVRGGTSYFASTTSKNTVHQDPPYDSDTTMRMTVRRMPSSGTDVVLTISSGQMMCPSYEGCSGTVRFDNGPARGISFNGPADSSSDTIFVVGAKSFIGNLKKSKKVIIEKTLYEAGNPQFEFDVSGLKWDH